MSKSKSWSSYEKDGKIMESWRRYVDNNDRWATYLNESRTTLTESEKNDLLQEIDFLKNLGARMRGAKQVRTRPNLTHGWEAAVAEFAAEDENAKRLAKSVGFDNIGSEKEFLEKIKMTIAAAQKSGDPELGAAAEELAQDVEQAAQQSSATAGAPQGGSEEGEKAPAFETSRSDIQAVLKNPGANIGPSMRFRTRVHQYLKAVGELPGNVNRNSPLIRGIVNIVQASLEAMGVAPQPTAESINKIFLPIIIEEVKKEKIHRILREELRKSRK